MNKYTLFTTSTQDFGGVIPLPEPTRPSTGCPYVLGCTTVDPVTRRVEALGGKVLMAWTDIPERGPLAVIADPTGGVVSADGLPSSRPIRSRRSGWWFRWPGASCHHPTPQAGAF